MKGIKTAILKQLAPIAVIPPSPKIRAWIIIATETANMAAQGPKIMAITAEPTAWPVVPPGMGKLNIIIINEKAAAIPRYGTLRAETSSLTFLTAMAADTTNTPNNGIYVCGLR